MKKRISKIRRAAALLLVATTLFTLPACQTENEEAAAMRQFSQLLQTAEVADFEALSITKEDKQDFFDENRLPALSRMSVEDTEKRLGKSQVLARMALLGIGENDLKTPKESWKQIYNDVYETLAEAGFGDAVEFTGEKVSELNEFLDEQNGELTSVLIKEEELDLDETLRVPSNIHLYGSVNGTTLSTDGLVTRGIYLNRVENVWISGLSVDGNCGYGGYVVESKNFLFNQCEFSEAWFFGLVMMGENEDFLVLSSKTHDNGQGGVYLDGNVRRGVFEDNEIYENRGTQNLTAGVTLSSIHIVSFDTTANLWYDEPLTDKTESPHNLIFYRNHIHDNHSSAIYSDGAYVNYFIDNELSQNDKEGMCFDYGSFGNYVSGNTVMKNGGRFRQTDGDLKRDFIYDMGRLPDGSSPAKLPGISFDNAAYNILVGNMVNENYGSGIKTVRSAYRNVILQNLVRDNNAGQSSKGHFYGIELGYAKEPDEPVEGLDFTPDYENIIRLNTVSGAYYAALYIEKGTYANDIYENYFDADGGMDVESFSRDANNAVYDNLFGAPVEMAGDVGE